MSFLMDLFLPVCSGIVTVIRQEIVVKFPEHMQRDTAVPDAHKKKQYHFCSFLLFFFCFLT